jgi:hypothetical protein
MKIVIKVNTYEDKEGKDCGALTDMFEVVTTGDNQKFLDLVGKIILLISPEKPADKTEDKPTDSKETKPLDTVVEKKDETGPK